MYIKFPRICLEDLNVFWSNSSLLKLRKKCPYSELFWSVFNPYVEKIISIAIRCLILVLIRKE